MSYVTTRDETRLFVNDWGNVSGPTLLFTHSWALDRDVWQYAHAHFAARGCRVVSFDRRGHGRSDQPRSGYDIDTLADDVSRVIEALDLHELTLIGHSMGCTEIIRYLTRHGRARVARMALVATTTPCLTKSDTNPEGIDAAFFESVRELWRRDFPAWVTSSAPTFFTNDSSPAMIAWGVQRILRTPLMIALACNEVVAELDCRHELRAIEVPALLIHGGADVGAPLALTARRTAELLPNSTLHVYPDAPHGLPLTHMTQLNADLSQFIGLA
jgi:non-heme chloroperoxidase